MTIYNTTAVDNSSTIYDFVINVNNIPLQNGVAGVPMIIFLYCLQIILLATVWGATKSPEKGFLYSSLVTTIVGSMLVFAGMLAWKIVAIPIVLLVASIIYMFISEG